MVIVAINDNADIVREEKLPASTTQLEKFFSTFDEPVQVVVERASNWYWLSDWCRANNIQLTLAHSKMVKAISYAKVKTDKVDARTLAELLPGPAGPSRYRVRLTGTLSPRPGGK